MKMRFFFKSMSIRNGEIRIKNANVLKHVLHSFIYNEIKLNLFNVI